MNVAKVLGVLVLLWIAIGVVGFIIHGLFWLFVLACVAFGFTLAGTAGGRRILNRR